jgi:ankyrin repeat and BTB/POZ domain-containing protein 1
MSVQTSRVGEIKWPHGNSIFADCLLRADEPYPDDEDYKIDERDSEVNGIPIGPAIMAEQPPVRRPKKSVLYPAHKAMLIRSPYFETMFSGDFVEAKHSDNLHVVTVDCIPEVLEIILAFLYTEKVDCPLELALDLLYAADMLFLDKLKTKAAVTISTLGSGNNNVLIDRTHGGGDQKGHVEMEPINIYDVIHAAWDLRVQRLEEFAARYIANRLEDYIDEEDFADLIKESADRLESRQETDTIELLDDIRYYLSERFRLRFEDAGLEEMMDENEINPEMTEAIAARIALNGDDEAGTEPPVDGEGVKTLDGKVAEDEFASDAINYQILLQKIDTMLDRLKLDA